MIHENIVRFISSFQTGPNLYIILELCTGGCLLDLLNCRLKNRLSTQEILLILQQTASALAYVHSLGLIHRDIKIENVLVQTTTQGNVYKLCDFGSVTDLVVPSGVLIQRDQVQRLREEIDRTTTPAYRAPELIDLNLQYGIDSKMDVWVSHLSQVVYLKALGILLYKLCFYTTPFENGGDRAVLQGSYNIPQTPVYPPLIMNLIGTISIQILLLKR